MPFQFGLARRGSGWEKHLSGWRSGILYNNNLLGIDIYKELGVVMCVCVISFADIAGLAETRE